jgi:molybdopterin-biosynthesis enzyme MoeA-like protein
MTDDKRSPPTLDNPRTWVGVLAGQNDVTVVFNPGTPQEQRVLMQPLVALSVASKMVEYAQRQLKQQAATITRHETNVTVRRQNLDS